jgi:ATP-dependent Clp protease ATP-binding subunit ClpC
VSQRPYSVILFDEVEKAHPDALNVLLQIMDRGRFTDSQGREVDFRNTIIVMTSNLGADLIRKSSEVGFGAQETNLSFDRMKEQIDHQVKKFFKPEFLNRLTDVLIFKPLQRHELLQVIDIEMKKLNDLLEQSSLYVTLDQKAKEFLVDKGFEPEMGARPLGRAIEQYLIDSLSTWRVTHPDEGMRCLVSADENGLTFVNEEVFAKPKTEGIKAGTVPAA